MIQESNPSVLPEVEKVIDQYIERMETNGAFNYKELVPKEEPIPIINEQPF